MYYKIPFTIFGKSPSAYDYFLYGFTVVLIEGTSGANQALAEDAIADFTKIWLEKCEDSSDGGETSDTAEKERKGENTAQSTEDTGIGTASTALNLKDTVALGTTTEYIDEYTYIETSYELTRYVNDINTAYVEVMMKYDENDNVKASYIYGTNRVSETLDNSVDKYYNYDIRGT